MLFNSLAFAVFLPVVFCIFWVTPQRFRWLVLLISSYYFYMGWNEKYVVLIFLVTVISYLTALLLSGTDKLLLKKLYLWGAAIVSLGILVAFKYFNFFASIVGAFLRFFSFESEMMVLDVLLPVGISFYTFQTLAYVVDVYRGTVPAEKHFGKYAAFISFFPQLVAGPIERTENLLPQIKKNFAFEYNKASYGLKLMAWGYFKKMIIADSLAVYVNRIYADAYNYEGFVFVIVTLMFGIQIYCDFSGYSDIAVGVAKLFDIDLMRNFDAPYFSGSIKEFWSRWHISLSTWFRDYVYIPLGGNRCSKWKHRRNLLITFFVSGLWHGASWNYVMWGYLHGVAQIVEEMICKNKRRSLAKNGGHWMTWLSVLFVFAFTMLTWFFFRIPDQQTAVYIIQHAFLNIVNPLTYVIQGIRALHIRWELGSRLIVMIGLLMTYDYFSIKMDVIQKISSLPGLVRWTIYIAFSLLMLVMLPSNAGGEFIYFQF